MATFLNTKVIEVAYETDFTITTPPIGSSFFPGNGITVAGTFTSPSNALSIWMFYNGTQVTSAITFDKIAGTFSYSGFVAALGKQEVFVEITWLNGTEVLKTRTFAVLAI